MSNLGIGNPLEIVLEKNTWTGNRLYLPRYQSLSFPFHVPVRVGSKSYIWVQSWAELYILVQNCGEIVMISNISHVAAT